MTRRGELVGQMRKIVQTLNELDTALDHGQVTVARDYSTVVRAELQRLTALMGLV